MRKKRALAIREAMTGKTGEAAKTFKKRYRAAKRSHVRRPR